MEIEKYEKGDFLVAYEDIMTEGEKLIARAGTRGKVLDVWDDPDDRYGQILDVDWDVHSDHAALYILTALDPITKLDGELLSN